LGVRVFFYAAALLAAMLVFWLTFAATTWLFVP